MAIHDLCGVGIFRHLFCYHLIIRKQEADRSRQEADIMKGYNTENGYMGYVEGRYLLFASEADYLDYMED